MPDAYSYLRFSSSRQATGDSLRRQTELAREYCAAHNLTLREELSYKDLGVSAFKGANAKTGRLADFLEAVKLGRVKQGSFLLVESLDRISRDSAHLAAALLTELVEAGVVVVTLLDEHIWDKSTISNTNDFLYSVMLFARAHDESFHKSKRNLKLYKGRRDRDERIICNTGPGWLQKNKSLKCWELVPERAEAVRRVFKEFLSGRSAHSICQQANLERWPRPSIHSKRGDGWHVSLVRRVIANRAVTGVYTEQSGKEHEGFFPRVISDEDFAMAQASTETRARFPRRRDETRYNVFQGLIRCGYCGATMGYRDHGSKAAHHPSETRRYFCTAHVRGATQQCRVRPGAQQTQRHLLASVYRNIASQITSEDTLAQASAAVETGKDLVGQLEKRYQRAYELAESSMTPPKIVVARLTQLELELDEAKAKLRSAQSRLAELGKEPVDLEAVEEVIGQVIHALDASPEARDEIRARIVRNVDSVYIQGREQLAAIVFRGDEKVICWCPIGPNAVVPETPPPLPGFQDVRPADAPLGAPTGLIAV